MNRYNEPADMRGLVEGLAEVLPIKGFEPSPDGVVAGVEDGAELLGLM